MENIPQKDEVSVVAGTARRHKAAGEGTGRSPFSRSDSGILEPICGSGYVDMADSMEEPIFGSGYVDLADSMNVGSAYVVMADSMDALMEIFSKDNAQPVLIDGSTNNPIPMDVLSYNHLFLFFSSLTNISDADIGALNIVYEEIKADEKSNIVWIPIVEQWTDDLRNEFEILRRKMPWYIVQCSSTLTAGNKFIKEKWNFEGKPIVVEMDKLGSVKNPDALPVFREQRMKAWPFLKRQEEKLKAYWREIKDVVGTRAD